MEKVARGWDIYKTHRRAQETGSVTFNLSLAAVNYRLAEADRHEGKTEETPLIREHSWRVYQRLYAFYEASSKPFSEWDYVPGNRIDQASTADQRAKLRGPAAETPGATPGAALVAEAEKSFHEVPTWLVDEAREAFGLWLYTNHPQYDGKLQVSPAEIGGHNG
jgi:hypothetical protein